MLTRSDIELANLVRLKEHKERHGETPYYKEWGEKAWEAAKLAVADLPGCHGCSDGECFWEHCPQLKDGESTRSGRHCPLDKYGEDL